MIYMNAVLEEYMQVKVTKIHGNLQAKKKEIFQKLRSTFSIMILYVCSMNTDNLENLTIHS